LFAYQTKQQVGLFLKDLIPLAAIGRAYVWRAGGTGQQGRAKSRVAEGKALPECALPGFPIKEKPIVAPMAK